MNSAQPVVQINHLVKKYGPLLAVDDISFEVHRGEIFGIVGPNGAGKTTTVETLVGMRRPDGGSLSVLGLDPQRQAMALRERIGVQLQQAALPEAMKVWEALDLFSAFYGHTRPWKPLLEAWGLAEKRRASFGSLSGGQRQRLFIALALVNDPEVVFLDELTTGLDPQARRGTWDLVRSIREQGKTVILITHFMDEAEKLCDRVAIIERGKLVALDSPEGLVQGLRAQTRVRFSTSNGFDPAVLRRVPGVAFVRRDGDEVLVEGRGSLLVLVAAALAERGQILAICAPNRLRWKMSFWP